MTIKKKTDSNEARFIVSVEQGSPEWKTLRAGKITASKVKDAMDRLKSGGEGAKRRELKIKLITESLTGEPVDDFFETAAVRWGKEQESYGRMYYEEIRKTQVRQIAFAHHPTIKQAGASPDGLVDSDGLLEIKCPMSHTHLNYIIAGEVPEEYKPQMLWQMICTGRKWCDFMSFDPRMPKPLRVFIRRYHFDQAALVSITNEVNNLNTEISEMIGKLAELSTDSLIN